MQHTIKYFFSFIFLCVTFLNSAASDSKADSLYSEGHYFEASIEYERQIFYAKTNDHQNYFQFQKGLCYKQLKDFSKATDVFQTIYFTNFNDTLYQQVCYQQSLCYYLQGEPSKALWKIDEYFHHCSDSSSYQVFMPIRLFSLNDTRQWHEAQKCFAQYVKMQAFSSEKELEVLEIVNSFYSKNNLPKIKSIEAAENWSRFIPGAGQIYSGETLEGFVNLLINSSILAFAGYQLYYHYYITGYLVGLGFFNKTYHGGMKRASILTSLENKKALIIFNNKINYFLQYNFYKKNLNKVN